MDVERSDATPPHYSAVDKASQWLNDHFTEIVHLFFEIQKCLAIKHQYIDSTSHKKEPTDQWKQYEKDMLEADRQQWFDNTEFEDVVGSIDKLWVRLETQSLKFTDLAKRCANVINNTDKIRITANTQMQLFLDSTLSKDAVNHKWAQAYVRRKFGDYWEHRWTSDDRRTMWADYYRSVYPNRMDTHDIDTANAYINEAEEYKKINSESNFLHDYMYQMQELVALLKTAKAGVSGTAACVRKSTTTPTVHTARTSLIR